MKNGWKPFNFGQNAKHTCYTIGTVLAKKKGPVFGFSHVDKREKPIAGVLLQRAIYRATDGEIVLKRAMASHEQRHNIDIIGFRTNYANSKRHKNNILNE